MDFAVNYERNRLGNERIRADGTLAHTVSLSSI